MKHTITCLLSLGILSSILILPLTVCASFQYIHVPPHLEYNKAIPVEISLAGTVKNEVGDPLTGAIVRLKGTSLGAFTDEAGNFELLTAEQVRTIRVSYPGYISQEIDVPDSLQNISILLTKSSQNQDEMVGIGYGAQPRAKLTGAIAVVDAELLENRPIVSAGQGLQGLIPNLNVSIRNGDPVIPAFFNIRGYESINGGSPLVLVDGVPMALERLNPNDIASVTVLKDASAAVYGERAAFGVILVETKSGKKEKVSISLHTELSVATPVFHMDPIDDPYQYVLARNKANIRTSGQTIYDNDYVSATKAWSEGTGPAWGVKDGFLRFYGFNDYQSQVLADYSPQQQYNMRISGGTENASYYISTGHLNKDGYLKKGNESFKRYNVLMKASLSVNKSLTFDQKVIFNQQRSDKPSAYHRDVNINTLARVNPIQPIQFPDLEYYLTPGDRSEYEPYIGMYFSGTNALPYLEHGGRTTYTMNDLWLSQGFTLNPVKGLTIKGNFSYNHAQTEFEEVQSKVDVIATTDLNKLVIDHGFSETDFIENQSDASKYYAVNTYAAYMSNPDGDHLFKSMVGFNQEWGNNTWQRTRAFSLITPLVPNINASTGRQETAGASSQLALRGFFYRLNYEFQNKYLFQASGRLGSSSRAPRGDQWGFFPAFSAGWRISEEAFMGDSETWLDDLKLRASYGILGNQLFSDGFSYIAALGISTSPFTGSNGLPTTYTPLPGPA